MSRVCAKCGRGITTLAKFCPGCGNPLPAAPVASEPAPYQGRAEFAPPKRPNPFKWLLGIAAVFGVMAGVGFVAAYIYSGKILDDHFTMLERGFGARASENSDLPIARELQDKHEKALEHIDNLMDLRPATRQRVRVYVAACSQFPGFPPGILAFANQHKTMFHRQTYVVFCHDYFEFLNSFLINKITIEFVFYHEMVHAVMMDIMGIEAFMELPMWFIEGSAEYGSGQARDRIHLMKQFWRQNAGFMQTAKKTQRDLSPADYAIFYLFFRFIRNLDGPHDPIAGEQRVAAFVNDVVVNRVPIERAVKTHTGLDYDAFHVQALAWARIEYGKY